jgi:hypothetical protein
MSQGTSYVRVAALVGDAYTRVSSVHAVAFKTSTAGTGPYDGNLLELKTFVETELAKTSHAVKAMFDPSNSLFKTQIPVGQTSNMIAFIDNVYTHGSTAFSPVTTDGQLYHVYIYAKNESSFELIQPSSVTVTN